ncbi:MAG: glycosyltransferase family 39 protein [Anaerolineae bacterium]
MKLNAASGNGGSTGLSRAVQWLAAGAAVFFAGLYFRAALPRVFYPYDLDFIEDGLLMAALRVANGLPLFVPPNADFVPHVYMPLYSWLGGLLFRLAGPGFAPLRALSLASVLACSGLIFLIARRESGRNWLGLACAGLWLGGYRISGFWYELARVDALFVALVVAGLALGTPGQRPISNRRQVAAGLVLALAFFTKQTGLVFGLGLGLYLWITIGRRAWPFGLSLTGLALPPALALNALSGGWFFYYTVTIASASPLEIGRAVHFLRNELFGLMAGLAVMALGAGLLAVRGAGWRGVLHRPWLIWTVLAVAVSGLGRTSVGGNLNNLMPAYALLCLAPALLQREWAAQPGLLPRWRGGLIAALILAQFALGAYNPLRYVPTPAMHRAGGHLIDRLRAVDGEVLVEMHPYYAWLAGKSPSAQMATIWHARRRGSQPLPPDFVARIQGQYYAAIISDESLFETEPDLLALLDAYYRPAGALGPDEAPATTTGLRVRPSRILVPRP